jgi:putative spermidine/putrescine transport system substrate-binding protein
MSTDKSSTDKSKIITPNPAETSPLKRPLGRRDFLKAAAVTGIAASGVNISFAQERSLRIGVYGGYFKDAFDEFVFPVFTEDTGIAVESVAQPTGEAWIVQLETAARAGQSPTDISMVAQGTVLRGINSGLWATLDDSMENLEFVRDPLLNRDPDGNLVGVGAVSWYITLVTNTDVYPEAPTSWASLWDEENRDRLGLLALPSNSFLLEVTAATFFDGMATLQTEEGLTAVFNKLAEVRPNVRLWYRDEGQFQQALQSGEIPMGQYYHDVTGLAAADGFPVRSTFPQEGGILDSGSWAATRVVEKMDEVNEFINWFSQPSIQDMVARSVGTSPTVRTDVLSLSEDEFSAVSSDIEPIIPFYGLYLERADEIEQRWREEITG